jgi:hypothetical protein
VVQDHFKTLGFAALAAPDGATDWVLDVADYRAHETQISIHVAAGLAAE